MKIIRCMFLSYLTAEKFLHVKQFIYWKSLWVVEIYIFYFTLQLNISSWQKGPDFSAVQLNGRLPPMYKRLVTIYSFLLDVKY